VHSVLAVCFFKGTSTTKPDKQARMDGVSTYLALTFGTLLSSQGTEASFGSGPVSRTSPSGLSLRIYTVADPVSRTALGVFTTLADSLALCEFTATRHSFAFPRAREKAPEASGRSRCSEVLPAGENGRTGAPRRAAWATLRTAAGRVKSRRRFKRRVSA
jgi:hypothetical protein